MYLTTEVQYTVRSTTINIRANGNNSNDLVQYTVRSTTINILSTELKRAK